MPLRNGSRAAIDLRSPSPPTRINHLGANPAYPGVGVPQAAQPQLNAPNRGNYRDVISLVDSDDEDAPPVNPVAAGRANRNRVIEDVDDFRATLEDLDNAIHRHNVGLARLHANPMPGRHLAEVADANYRNNGRDPMALQPPRIRLGGAMMRYGNQRVRFAPGNVPERHEVLNADGNQHNEDPFGAQAQAGPGPAAAAAARADTTAADLLRNRLLEPPFLRNVAGFMLDGLQRGNAELKRETILGQIKPETIAAAKTGCIRSWNPEDVASHQVKDGADQHKAIELDTRGRVLPSKHKLPKPYLSCANCPEPLRISGAARNSGDAVWALRCGHLIDERCFDKISRPEHDDDDDDENSPPPKQRRTKHRRPRRRARAPVYRWKCPIATCGREHISVKDEMEDKWYQKDGHGALQVFL